MPCKCSLQGCTDLSYLCQCAVLDLLPDYWFITAIAAAPYKQDLCCCNIVLHFISNMAAP